MGRDATKLLQSCYKGTVFPVAIQFTVAPPQHRLYFLPDPQGHGSFCPTLGVVPLLSW
jgi:hypothetical protein